MEMVLVRDLASDLKNQEAVFKYINEMVGEKKPEILKAALDSDTRLGLFFSIKNPVGFFSRSPDFGARLLELQRVIDSITPQSDIKK